MHPYTTRHILQLARAFIALLLRMPTKGVPSADFWNSDVNVEGDVRDVFAEVGRGEDVFDERRHELWHRRMAQPVQEGDA